MPTELKGMTWSHSRGYSSIVAVSQRYEELNSNIKITWEKRSLSKFENEPVGELAEKYDMLIIDHPWSGFGASTGVLLPLEEYIPKEFLKDQEENSTGASYQSYNIFGHQVALPIDGATPVAIYRQDLVDKNKIPETWEEMIEFAKREKVIYAAAPLYTLLDFIMMCASVTDDDSKIFNEKEAVNKEIGLEALERMRELAVLCNPVIYDINPIDTYEIMGRDDGEFSYCPFIYGYSNYCRRGYVPKVLKATDVVSYKGKILRTTLGGTGLAISQKCKYLKETIDFVLYAASPEIQKTIFFDAGGQPGHKEAWLDSEVNKRSNNFFADTLKTMESAYIRPRYNGYIDFQNKGGTYIQEYLKTGSDSNSVLEKINKLYRESRGERHEAVRRNSNFRFQSVLGSSVCCDETC